MKSNLFCIYFYLYTYLFYFLKVIKGLINLFTLYYIEN